MDIEDKIEEVLNNMTSEDHEEFQERMHEKYAEKMRSLYGEDWKAIQKAKKKLRYGTSVSAPSEHFDLMKEKEQATRELLEARSKLEDVKGRERAYAEKQTGYKLYESIKLEHNGNGVIAGFELLENGTVLLNVRFQFSNGTYHPDEVVESYGVREGAEQHV